MTRQTEALNRPKYETQHVNDAAPVESPEQSWVSNRGSSNEFKDHLKGLISFASLLKADGHHLKGSGKYKSCLCPFHVERTPSFNVKEDSGWAKCFGCSWSGDIFNYVMDAYQMTFSEAVECLSDQVQSIGRPQGVLAVRPKSAVSEAQELTTTQQEALKAASKRLAENDARCLSVASERAWNPSTIKALAEEGSLGWDGGALAFLYPVGMKSRNWPHRNFLWDFGKPGVWRGSQIGDAMEVFICEGETDCISLVDKDIEEDGSMAVIALPSASTIPSDLPKLVQGRHVTLCMDDDDAGAIATAKLADLLEDVCASVQTFNFAEVAQ
jgi:DNA primase